MSDSPDKYFHDYVYKLCRDNGLDYTYSIVLTQQKNEIIKTYSYQRYCFYRACSEFIQLLKNELVPILEKINKFLVKISNKKED
jgi:hypothetical protein